MKNNNFIWVDLSCYDPEEAQKFYGSVFDWQYHETSGYAVAYSDSGQVSGLYKTPDKFRKINMPAFWMSYISVLNLEKTIEKAKEL